MKNLKKWTLLFISLFIVTMTACKQSTSGSFTGSDKQPLNITIAQNESIKFEKTSRSARTIVAEPFSAKTDLTFYLWGKAQSGQELAPKTVTVTSDDGIVGKVILDIDCYNWSLTLAACDSTELPTPANTTLTESEVLEKAVLIGYGNVDMMFTNQIKFTLTPKGLSKTGKVNLTLKLESGTNIPAGPLLIASYKSPLITTSLPSSTKHTTIPVSWHIGKFSFIASSSFSMIFAIISFPKGDSSFSHASFKKLINLQPTLLHASFNKLDTTSVTFDKSNSRIIITYYLF